MKYIKSYEEYRKHNESSSSTFSTPPPVEVHDWEKERDEKEMLKTKEPDVDPHYVSNLKDFIASNQPNQGSN